MRPGSWILILMVTIGSGPAAAQGVAAGRAGPRTILPREREIALARSAAPLPVSRDATVMVLTERGFEVAVKGTSGVTCVVNRSHPRSLEPHCFDAEGSATVLPMELRRTEMLRAELGLAGTRSTQAALVVDEGKAISSIMIVVKDFAGR